MRRPVWLFSMDTEQFCAPPMTTGALKAHFAARGRSATSTDVELVHFLERSDIEHWLEVDWPLARNRARQAHRDGVAPLFGFSCYTWNVAEFLELARLVRLSVPEAVLVAGGPHVQRAADFLGSEALDVIALGEGERTFTELLDCRSRDEWASVAGLAFLDADGRVQQTAPRPRAVELDELPSALDVLELCDAGGRPRYKKVAYETSRGCPYLCSFCEWGTGAIGTKIFQFSLGRIRADLERLADGGIEDVWLCDSNFGALREDLAKAEIIVELRRRSGALRGFATSWSKNHNRRVHEIVRLMHREGLLSHYHLALQTLTPRALELCRRTNMRANDYEPVVRALAAEGIPVAAELIWPLPGDTLEEFEQNLDHLHTVFPNINIFGYTLLPGTEFFDRRDELQLETIPVAGYGKAKGEYVVGCQTLSRDEGEEGYFSVAAQIVFARGHLIPLTIRHLAIDGRVAVGALLRTVLRDLLAEFASELDDLDPNDRMSVYERRGDVFRLVAAERARAFTAIGRTIAASLREGGLDRLAREALQALELDQALCPRRGPSRTIAARFAFRADRAIESLESMRAPDPSCWLEDEPIEIAVHHPGGAGDVIREPDGGAWIKGRVVARSSASVSPPHQRAE